MVCANSGGDYLMAQFLSVWWGTVSSPVGLDQGFDNGSGLGRRYSEIYSLLYCTVSLNLSPDYCEAGVVNSGFQLLRLMGRQRRHGWWMI